MSESLDLPPGARTIQGIALGITHSCEQGTGALDGRSLMLYIHGVKSPRRPLKHTMTAKGNVVQGLAGVFSIPGTQ
jgi:hypothetical protein